MINHITSKQQATFTRKQIDLNKKLNEAGVDIPFVSVGHVRLRNTDTTHDKSLNMLLNVKLR